MTYILKGAIKVEIKPTSSMFDKLLTPKDLAEMPIGALQEGVRQLNEQFNNPKKETLVPVYLEDAGRTPEYFLPDSTHSQNITGRGRPFKSHWTYFGRI